MTPEETLNHINPLVKAGRVMDRETLMLLLDGAHPQNPLCVTAGTVKELLDENERLKSLLSKASSLLTVWWEGDDRFTYPGLAELLDEIRASGIKAPAR